MSESAIAANSMQSGENIATYDPVLKIKPKKKLRDVIGRKEKKNGD